MPWQWKRLKHEKDFHRFLDSRYTSRGGEALVLTVVKALVEKLSHLSGQDEGLGSLVPRNANRVL